MKEGKRESKKSNKRQKGKNKDNAEKALLARNPRNYPQKKVNQTNRDFWQNRARSAFSASA